MINTMINPCFSLAYVTNFWGHHQAPVSREFVRLLGEERFRLCLFGDVHASQFILGFDGSVPDYRWIAGPRRAAGDLERLVRIVCDADVAVLGACPREVMVARAGTGKLTFIMSEREWKTPPAWWRWLDPRFHRGLMMYRRIANRENVHYLAMGAYAADDVRHIGAYGDRLWTWAYLPEVAPQPPQPRTNARMRILWVGRMLDWKRVDLLLQAIARVYRESTFGTLDIVGTGPEKEALLELARRLELGDRCNFHEPVSPAKVRELMRQSDVYVLPSNRHEGWGAVANEAMSEGAVLVANEQAGAARVLIDHGRTGFLFEDDNVAALTAILKNLLTDAALRETVRQAAWLEMQQMWHPRVGAERLVSLCQGLLGQIPMPVYKNGLCSRSGEKRI
jgi:glycosyltransferase involved in cell wall biosynthesis